jgi:hypothetical protein
MIEWNFPTITSSTITKSLCKGTLAIIFVNSSIANYTISGFLRPACTCIHDMRQREHQTETNAQKGRIKRGLDLTNVIYMSDLYLALHNGMHDHAETA